VGSFLQAIYDETLRRGRVARTAGRIGGARNALAGGVAPYAVKGYVERRRAVQGTEEYFIARRRRAMTLTNCYADRSSANGGLDVG
jgi:hypothetical protein